VDIDLVDHDQYNNKEKEEESHENAGSCQELAYISSKIRQLVRPIYR